MGLERLAGALGRRLTARLTARLARWPHWSCYTYARAMGIGRVRSLRRAWWCRRAYRRAARRGRHD